MSTDRQTGELTGYPSIDKPWLNFFSEKQINNPLPKCSLYEFLWNCNKDHLDMIALNYFGNKISYRELFSMIDEVSKSFIAIGVKEKDIVPIVSVSTVPSILCFYALNQIGAISDYINVLSEEKDLCEYFGEVNAKVVVTLDLFGVKVINAASKCNVKTVVTFGVNQNMPFSVNVGYRLKTRGKIPKIPAFEKTISWDEFIKRASEVKEISCKKDSKEMCLLAHTGGTTGFPKAVMLSDNAMNAVVSQYIDVSGINRGEIFLNLMIPFVVYGILTNVHLPLCIGLQSVVVPKFDANDWGKYLKKYHPNHILAVPSYVSPMLRHPKLQSMDMSCFISAGVGGDGMTNEIEISLNDFYKKHNSKAVVLKGYGMTEVCATAVVGFSYSNKLGSAGIPLPKVNMMIWDRENNRELPYNEVGEICIQSPSRMIGYMKNESATEELFWKHDDGSEWLHSGDLGYIDEEGFLFLVGRMKRVILTTKDGVAYKVFPNIPEKILDSHQSVVQSCIVGAKEGEDQVLRAFIVINHVDTEEIKRIEKELRMICEEQLPSYSRPTTYRFLESLPLTAVGKIDYLALESEK